MMMFIWNICLSSNLLVYASTSQPLESSVSIRPPRGSIDEKSQSSHELSENFTNVDINQMKLASGIYLHQDLTFECSHSCLNSTCEYCPFSGWEKSRNWTDGTQALSPTENIDTYDLVKGKSKITNTEIPIPSVNMSEHRLVWGQARNAWETRWIRLTDPTDIPGEGPYSKNIDADTHHYRFLPINYALSVRQINTWRFLSRLNEQVLKDGNVEEEKSGRCRVDLIRHFYMDPMTKSTHAIAEKLSKSASGQKFRAPIIKSIAYYDTLKDTQRFIPVDGVPYWYHESISHRDKNFVKRGVSWVANIFRNKNKKRIDIHQIITHVESFVSKKKSRLNLIRHEHSLNNEYGHGFRGIKYPFYGRPRGSLSVFYDTGLSRLGLLRAAVLGYLLFYKMKELGHVTRKCLERAMDSPKGRVAVVALVSLIQLIKQKIKERVINKGHFDMMLEMPVDRQILRDIMVDSLISSSGLTRTFQTITLVTIGRYIFWPEQTDAIYNTPYMSEESYFLTGRGNNDTIPRKEPGRPFVLSMYDEALLSILFNTWKSENDKPSNMRIGPMAVKNYWVYLSTSAVQLGEREAPFTFGANIYPGWFHKILSPNKVLESAADAHISQFNSGGIFSKKSEGDQTDPNYTQSYTGFFDEAFFADSALKLKEANERTNHSVFLRFLMEKGGGGFTLSSHSGTIRTFFSRFLAGPTDKDGKGVDVNATIIEHFTKNKVVNGAIVNLSISFQVHHFCVQSGATVSQVESEIQKLADNLNIFYGGVLRHVEGICAGTDIVFYEANLHGARYLLPSLHDTGNKLAKVQSRGAIMQSSNFKFKHLINEKAVATDTVKFWGSKSSIATKIDSFVTYKTDSVVINKIGKEEFNGVINMVSRSFDVPKDPILQCKSNYKKKLEGSDDESLGQMKASSLGGGESPLVDVVNYTETLQEFLLTNPTDDREEYGPTETISREEGALQVEEKISDSGNSKLSEMELENMEDGEAADPALFKNKRARVASTIPKIPLEDEYSFKIGENVRAPDLLIPLIPLDDSFSIE